MQASGLLGKGVVCFALTKKKLKKFSCLVGPGVFGRVEIDTLGQGSETLSA